MFALVDCNNFYASCERVFNPSLRNKPVVVLSNNDGCVIARSNEAKQTGVKMGQPAFEIKDLIEKYNIHVFSTNFALYGDMSQRVMNILAEFSPDIEIYSIDEAFLGFDGFELYEIPSLANEIRMKVSRYTGIPVSVGIAPTKTLAKIANHLAKKNPEKNGVCILNDEGTRNSVLSNFPIEEIWGIGRQYAKFLARFDIKTAMDFLNQQRGWVQKQLTVMGVRIQDELRGISCIELESVVRPKKSICNARSFGTMLTDIQPIEEAVCNFASRCAIKLRLQNSCANIITVFIHTNPHRKDHKQYARNRVIQLPVATNSTIEIVKYARIALQSIFKSGYSYKKAGVIVSGIVQSDSVQQALFDDTNRAQHQKVMSVMDNVNMKYGKDKLRLGSQGFTRKWKLRQEKLSPCYTTNWDEIITIKT